MNHSNFSVVLLALLMAFGCQVKEEYKRPNILIAIADDASFPHMSAYGCRWVTTPAFDRVAKGGLLFNNAYTPNAKCAPSRACIITGRNSWQLEEAANHVPYFPAKFKTYPEALRESGYFTGYTTKGWSPGNPGEINGTRRQLVGKAYNDVRLTPPTTGISANDYAANFQEFLKERNELTGNDKEKPFCFWYGSIEPHRGYEYGSGIALADKKLASIDSVFSFWPDNDTIKTDLLDYAFEIEYFDSHLDKMLKILESIGELDNTIVIVTADNGMPFPRVKGQAYEYSNHLPLAIMWGKGIKNPGRVIDDYVSFIDIAPTLLDAANIKASESGMQPMEGKSLVSIFDSEEQGTVEPARDHVLIGKERHDVGRPGDQGYPIRGIVKGGYLYIRNFKIDRWPAGDPVTGYLNTDASPTKTQILKDRRSGKNNVLWNFSFGKRQEEELYNIVKDPSCMKNLAFDSNFLQLKIELKRQMENELMAQDDPRILGNADIFDNYMYADENTRDFYARFVNGELDSTSASWVNPSDFEPQAPLHE
jgi:N-sulfoglucosamine sulfohydrolase